MNDAPPLNLVEIETRRGFRSFELHCADITRIKERVDVLVVSAFAGSYEPTPGTVIGALEAQCGISMEKLYEDPEFDFVDGLGCWASNTLTDQRFTRLICVEIIGKERTIEEAIENVFVMLSLLELKGVAVESVAFPILGAGEQGLDAGPTISTMLEHGLALLKRSEHLTRILFVEKDPERAAQLDEAMNRLLCRSKVTLPKGQLAEGVRDEVLKLLDRVIDTTEQQTIGVFWDLRSVLKSPDSRSLHQGIASRNFVEVLVDRLVETKGDIDLKTRIDRVPDKEIAPWIASYMHVLRIFGNESAHDRSKSKRTPASINEADLALCLFCIQRLLDFYLLLSRKKRLR